MTQWRQYKDTHYSVSNDGQVRDDNTQCLLNIKYNKNGNATIAPVVGPRRVDKLVAETWLGCSEVAHKDGNQANCSVDNLVPCEKGKKRKEDKSELSSFKMYCKRYF